MTRGSDGVTAARVAGVLQGGLRRDGPAAAAAPTARTRCGRESWPPRGAPRRCGRQALAISAGMTGGVDLLRNHMVACTQLNWPES
jgi:hypothetical protein